MSYLLFYLINKFNGHAATIYIDANHKFIYSLHIKYVPKLCFD